MPFPAASTDPKNTTESGSTREMIASHEWRRRLLRVRTLMWAGIATTGLLLAAAMLWYPGDGSELRGGFSFWDDFLSSMGRMRAGSGDNTVSCLIFNGTLIMGGPVLAMFWNARASFLTQRRTATLVQRCGMGMALAIAGIGLAPCDYLPQVHDVMTYAAIVLGVVCFGLCLFGSHRQFESVPSNVGWLTILVLAGAAQAVIQVLIMAGELPSRPALPLMQKLFILLLVAWAWWQGLLFGRACRVEPAATVFDSRLSS